MRKQDWLIIRQPYANFGTQIVVPVIISVYQASQL